MSFWSGRMIRSTIAHIHLQGFKHKKAMFNGWVQVFLTVINFTKFGSWNLTVDDFHNTPMEG